MPSRSFSATFGTIIRFCCVGPAPFDDIADMCDECEQQFPQSTRVRSPEPSSCITCSAVDKNLNVCSDSLARKASSTICVPERDVRLPTRETLKAPDLLYEAPKAAQSALLYPAGRTCANTGKVVSDHAGKTVRVERIQCPGRSMTAEGSPDPQAFGDCNRDDPVALHPQETEYDLDAGNKGFGDNCAALQATDQCCTSADKAKSRSLSLSSKKDDLRDLRRSEQPYGLPRVA